MIIPGFIDVHAHWNGFTSRYPARSWELETFLAYGVTTLHKCVLPFRLTRASRFEPPNVSPARAPTTCSVMLNAAVWKVGLRLDRASSTRATLCTAPARASSTRRLWIWTRRELRSPGSRSKAGPRAFRTRTTTCHRGESRCPALVGVFSRIYLGLPVNDSCLLHRIYP